jgi:hypothetical protein
MRGGGRGRIRGEFAALALFAKLLQVNSMIDRKIGRRDAGLPEAVVDLGGRRAGTGRFFVFWRCRHRAQLDQRKQPPSRQAMEGRPGCGPDLARTRIRRRAYVTLRGSATAPFTRYATGSCVTYEAGGGRSRLEVTPRRLTHSGCLMFTARNRAIVGFRSMTGVPETASGPTTVSWRRGRMGWRRTPPRCGSVCRGRGRRRRQWVGLEVVVVVREPVQEEEDLQWEKPSGPLAQGLGLRLRAGEVGFVPRQGDGSPAAGLP